MEYYTNDQLYEYFQTEIKTASEKKIAELKAEINKMKAEGRKKIEAELQASFAEEAEIEQKEIRTDYSFELNRIQTDNARKLMGRRQELLNSVFAEVETKVLAFMKTKAYVDLMNEKVKGLKKIFGDSLIQFQISPKDEAIKGVIEKALPGKNEIQENPEIRFGGFFADNKAKGIEVDETLGFRLNEKKQWFYETSNLYIKK